jgi:hypothetical protein
MGGAATMKKTAVFADLSRKLREADDVGKSFFENTIVRFSLLAGVLLNLSAWVLLGLFIRPERSVVILHYNVYFGVDVIGVWQQAYLLPAIGLLLFGLDVFLAGWFYGKKERVASYVLLLASIMVELGVAVASGGIVLVNY